MSASHLSEKAGAAALGFLVGGATGFFLTETVGAFFTFVLDRTLDVDGTGALLAAFIAVPAICAIAGAFIGARKTGRRHTQQKGWQS